MKFTIDSNGYIKKSVIVVIVIGVFLLTGTIWYLYENLEKYVYPTLIPPAAYWVDQDKPLHEQTGRVKIAGRVFEIPLMYFSGRLKAAQKNNSVALRYVLPNFQTKLQLTKAQYKRALDEHRNAGMLIEESDKRPSFSRMIENRKRLLKKVEWKGSFKGLEIEHWYRERQGKTILYYEVYLEKNENGKILSFIECSINAPFPGCDDRFRNKGLLYKTHYNKEKYLSSWREQRNKAIKFFDSFEVSNHSQREE